MAVTERISHAARTTFNRDVFKNAASLYGATVVTSLLGFVFWLVAARTFPVSAVATASASVAAMQLLTEFGMLGMGSLIIAKLADEEFPAGLVSAGTLTAAVASSALGIGYVLMQHVISVKLGPMGHGLVGPGLFIAGVGVNAYTAVLDMAAIAINRGGLQLGRNTVFSAVKLLLLLLAAVLTLATKSELIYGAWLGGNVLSLVTFWFNLRRVGIRPRLRPALRLIFAARREAFAHHWLIIAATTPSLVLPLLVAAVLSPRLTAAFYVIVMIVGFANIVSAHFSTALFALPRGDLDRLATEVRFTLRVSAAVAVVSAIGFAVFGRFVLSIFGGKYAAQWPTMALLGISTIPYTVLVHYMSVERVRGFLTRCAAVTTVGVLLTIGLAYLGSQFVGLPGVAGGLDVAALVEAVVLWPTVARAAQVPILGNPAWLWREGAVKPPRAIRSTDERAGRPGRSRRQRPPRPPLQPGDPRFLAHSERLQTARDGRLGGWLRALPALGWEGVRLIGPVWRAETVHLPVAEPRHPTAFQEAVTWRAGPFPMPRPLLCVVALMFDSDDEPSAASDRRAVYRAVESAKRGGLEVAVLERVDVARALYATCIGLSPARLEHEDPAAHQLLRAPGLVSLAVLDHRQGVVCMALAVCEGDQACIARLVHRGASAQEEDAFIAAHLGLARVLAGAGVTHLWTDGPIGMDASRQRWLRVLGYECRRLRISGADS